MIMQIQALDYEMLRAIVVQLRTFPLTAVMLFITHLGDAGFLWLVCAAVCLVRPRTRRCGIVILACLLLGLIVGNGMIKPLIARPRPFITFPELLPLIEQGGWSFPSAHAMSSFSAATAIFAFYRKPGIICYVMAALIAFSRLYVCVHYPSDVLCGILLGLAIGLICSRLIPYLLDRISRRTS